LQKFDAISVREQEGVDLCNTHLAVTAKCVLDPTMLVSAHDYRKLVDNSEKIAGAQLTTYILDMNEEKATAIQKLTKLKNAHCVELGQNINRTKCRKLRKSIENWLDQFMKADFIITDSFHGCVFAIL